MTSVDVDHRAAYDRFISRQFGMVVLQPTTLCQWACDYCYLATTKQRLEMSAEVVAAVADSIRAQGADRPVTVVWHGGEPLALGIERFIELLEPFEELRRQGLVRHSIQTNAGLVTSRWCDLFLTHGFAVGVSLDGPEWANTARRDRAGRATHERAMRGVALLREQRIPFTVIAVVTPDTIDRGDELIDFFERLKPRRVAFNLEEFEGVNVERPVIDAEAATRFWYALIRRRSAGTPLGLRDVDRLLSHLRSVREPAAVPMRGSGLYEPIPTVAWNGDTVLLSPELAGTHAPEYGDFVVGNVLEHSLPAILGNAHEFRYVREFASALGLCAANCEFYDFCRGAQAGNRYFEHGDFLRSETTYCVNTRQSLVRALDNFLEQETRR